MPDIAVRQLTAENLDLVVPTVSELGGDKPRSQYERYLSEQDERVRTVFLAFSSTKHSRATSPGRRLPLRAPLPPGPRSLAGPARSPRHRSRPPALLRRLRFGCAGETHASRNRRVPARSPLCPDTNGRRGGRRLGHNCRPRGTPGSLPPGYPVPAHLTPGRRRHSLTLQTIRVSLTEHIPTHLRNGALHMGLNPSLGMRLNLADTLAPCG